MENKSNLFSIIIPTMWKSNKIFHMLGLYQNSKYVKEIIIIDNDPSKKIDLTSYDKVKYFTAGQNIYVNPAWNIGFTLSSYKTILANDDIIIDNIDGVLNLILRSDYDIIGVDIKNKGETEMRVNKISQFPANSYGCFMYIKNYKYIPEKYKIWYGDEILFNNADNPGILVNSGIITNVSETLNSNNQKLRVEVAKKDVVVYNESKNDNNISPQKILVVLVNYGDEQLSYLKQVVDELKRFKKHNVRIIVNSNIDLSIPGIDKVNVFNDLKDYQLLPLTCRTTIWDNRNDYDIFIFGENDHLFKEFHIDKHIEYSQILPKNRIPGLIQYEERDCELFYPAYHAQYEWDFSSVEVYDNKKFAHFTNLHQATFILTKSQLLEIGKVKDFTKFFGKSHYSDKCKVNTDIYQFSGLKKVICVSEFKENLIHHLPNLYIDGIKGRNKNQRADSDRMEKSIAKLLGGNINKNEIFGTKVVCGIATTENRIKSLQKVVESIINQVDELHVYQNGYKNILPFLNNKKIFVHSSLDTGVDMGDAGKFYTADKHENCYYISIDDDIIYPKNYVSDLISWIKKYNYKSVVSYHGRKFHKKVQNYYNDLKEYYHFGKKLSNTALIDFPGTGVMGFHTKKVKINFSDFNDSNIADIIVGVLAKKNGINCICLPHEEKWLIDSPDYNQNDTLFNKNKTNNKIAKYLVEFNKYKIETQKIVILSTLWNAKRFLHQYVNSIKNQTHKNFVVYIVDDNSNDGSYEVLLKLTSGDNRFKVFKNTFQKFKTQNFYEIIHNSNLINDNDIIIELDGDDAFYNKTVIEKVYTHFKDPNLWIAGYKWIDNRGQKSPFRHSPNADNPRSQTWSYSAMRVFKAFLFRNIKQTDLMFEGKFIRAANDVAYGMPMLEMSGREHFKSFNDVTYLYNWHDKNTHTKTSSVRDTGLQKRTEKHIYSLPRYDKLILPEIINKIKNHVITPKVTNIANSEKLNKIKNIVTITKTPKVLEIKKEVNESDKQVVKVENVKIPNNSKIRKLVSLVVTPPQKSEGKHNPVNIENHNKTKVTDTKKIEEFQNREIKSNPKVRFDNFIVKPQNKEEINKKREEFENILLFGPNGKKKINPIPPKSIGISV